ncbi:hypothetical protein [Listeria seeligeri]|uniref:hypothetical protein n=1 Tax=Listeria seeligeri TaxID=1640 RepID=UPI00162A012A|nr:hypothetical protein [Listeria seeligeri]MBC1917032.1 hypothetical protein [Listeria seeligeri]MBC1990412.1 hypothetical protein [Listeria seeligeri]MBF2356058.1 hypothetical protein [Listeria seeligeri]MBF2375225.1 hypothetical protein [Listeria seeligeri]UCK61896.1 hypothetical protein pLIS51_00456c [Listeria seeligeri]
MTIELDTQKETLEFRKKALQIFNDFTEKNGLPEKDRTVIQPYQNGESIIIHVSEDVTKRIQVEVKVTNTVIVMDKIEGSLDIFSHQEKEI